MNNLTIFFGKIIVILLIWMSVIISAKIIEIQLDDPLDAKFQDYLTKFNKEYKDIEEYRKRFTIFKTSLKEIQILNSKGDSQHSAHYGLTKYSDMTKEEFLKLALTNYSSQKQNFEINKQNQSYFVRQKRTIAKKIPLNVDWRNITYVSDVKNQRNCGACWAFSVIAVVESMNSLKYNKSENLSIQQMIDCTRYGNHGCLGGDMCTLLQWLTDNNVTIETEEHYPLQLKNDQCKVSGNTSGVIVNRYICQSYSGNENLMLKLLATHGPLSVSINALTWQNYIGGIIQFHCSSLLNDTNHAVQVVGYNLSHELPHYIVRNSWGKEFGDNGYLYIAIGKNMCGIANEVVALSVL